MKDKKRAIQYFSLKVLLSHWVILLAAELEFCRIAEFTQHVNNEQTNTVWWDSLPICVSWPRKKIIALNME